ncbi:MAG: polyphosphate kinase 1 [Rikenellaceae bacterium]
MGKNIYNRELSWLEFNDRVLQEAQDKSVPLMQRLRFLGIFSNNQDEFIKVRVANLIRYNQVRSKEKIMMTANYTPAELLPLIYKKIDASQKIFRYTYEEILKELETHGVYVVNEENISQTQKEFCLEYFMSVISLSLVPLILRKKVDTPLLAEGKVYLAVKMSRKNFSRYAILQLPVSSSCPRFVVLPSEDGRKDVIFIDDIVRMFLDDIFFMFNYDTVSAYTFKIIRDAELAIDDDVSKSLAEKMSQSITNRKSGKTVRLIYDMNMPEDVLNIISDKLGIKSKQLAEPGGRYHQMRDLMKFPKVAPKLESSHNKPILHEAIDPFDSILKVIKKRDILLCYPYHTFNHFIDALREAAVDPLVHSISITLYRTAEHSKVINALINAAHNGKKVTVFVELKARFDEEQNISNVELLQKAGIKVIDGIEGLKVHSKLVLIERMEGRSGLCGYVYVGTGNFNENTATIYSDFGLFTYDKAVVDDARKIFDFLQVAHKYPEPKKLLLSPYYMRGEVVKILETEMKQAKKGKKAYFYAKFNSLTDEKIIRLLYEASNAGVKIKLLIRGACCLKAGEKGLSENIEVRSIIDKYLEHARMMVHYNGGTPQSYIMSADLMTRNLDKRVEVGIPIVDKYIHQTLIDYFKIQWNDNIKARLISEPFDNRYIKAKHDEDLVRSQDKLHEYFSKKTTKNNE